MTDATLSLTAVPAYEGTNRLILGIVLAVVTFWLFDHGRDWSFQYGGTHVRTKG
jgi:hypothetical protein